LEGFYTYCHDLFFLLSLFTNHYGHLAPGRPSLYDLYWGKFQNRLYDDYDDYDDFTIIIPLHYDVFRFTMTYLTPSYLRLETHYYTMTSRLTCRI